MKQSKTIVIVLLVVLMIGGWSSALLDTESGENAEYKSHVKVAKEYVSRGLYQKAIEEYEEAVSIQNLEKDWTSMLKAYASEYEENSKIYYDYVEAAKRAVSAYNKNADYAITLANLYMDKEEYDSAYKCLKQAADEGIENKTIEKLTRKARYAYQVEWISYTDYCPLSNGYYAVSETGVWTYVAEDGTDTDYVNLKFAGPVGESGIRLIYDDKAKLIDENEVIQGIISFCPKESGIYSDGLIPVKKDDSFSYYDSLGDKQFGEYSCAGTYVGGKAAVKKGDKWEIINKEGDKVSSETYNDIVLNDSQKYIINDVMLAKKRKKYQLFDKNENVIGSFSCDDIDIATENGWIAFCDNGKWGFVDNEGKIVIKPTYDEAKSFSNGLAAVSNGDKWGFIDTSGKIVIDYQFWDADYFNSEGCCMVETGKDVWQIISLYIAE